MPSHYSLYKDRIFGDDETPPRATAPKPQPKPAPTPTNSSDEKTTYPLNRDAFASARLNLQHHLYHLTFNYLLHPSIALPASPLIADIGCGTGIWSIDTSKTLPPSAQIHAYDLSLAQTPPKEWSPANVTFSQMDIFAPIPSHLLERYDVVNIRLFICVVKGNDPIPLLKNLMKLLKPGGYLQWQEYDHTTYRVRVADSGKAAPKMDILNEAFAPGGVKDHWVPNMHTRFGEAGGMLHAHDRQRAPKEYWLLSQDTMFMGAYEFIANMKKKGDAETVREAEKKEKIVRDAEEECWRMGRGTVIESELVTWVVRKR